MAIRTIEEIQDALDGTLSWRRTEIRALVSAFTSAERSSAGSPLSRALARGCATLIYAHWEGFVKDALQFYAEFLSRRRLKYRELSDGLLRTALMGLAKRLMAGDEAGAAALVQTVRRPQESRWLMQRSSMVDTKSNL